MVRIALTHTPSPRLASCELTFLPQDPIDVRKAVDQHRCYCDMLRRCGLHVITSDQNRDMPDSVFVEDTAVVLDEVGILTPMGVASRQDEGAAIAGALAGFRPLKRLSPPASLEGGDVLRIGRRLFVGRSPRTDGAGIAALERIVRPLGYQVIDVRVHGCLHLKTGCTALDDNTILVNDNWIDTEPFAGLRTIAVPAEEPFGANILRVGHIICMHAGFEETRRVIEAHGYQIEVVDISEFLKAEAGMTCMSLLFSATSTTMKGEIR